MCGCGRVCVHRRGRYCTLIWRVNPRYIAYLFKRGRTLASLNKQFGGLVVARALRAAL